jgi:RHS repeat-associated protein
MRRQGTVQSRRGLSAALVAVVSAGIFVFVLSGAAGAAPPANAVTYAYDELGRLVAVSDPASGTAKYNYDAVGNLTSVTRQAVSVVSIASFSPKAGPSATTVSIYGTGFSAMAGQNTVKFNGTVAAITSASTSQLVVTVPAGATTGTINVASPGGSATSSSSFTVGAAGPSITGFSPSVAGIGGSVTVSGTKFDTTASNDVVATGMARAQVTAATATSLTATVAAAASGHITVATPLGNTLSSGILFVAPSPYVAADVDATAQMAIGDSRTLAVSTANKISLAAFDGTSGQRVALNFTSIAFGGSTCCAAKVSILAPDGSTRLSPTYVGSQNSFVDAVTLTQDGTYTIVLDPEGTSTGNATFTLVNVPADASAAITPGGAPITVTTTVPGQNASLTFSGTQNQRVSLNLDQVTIGSSACCSAKVSIVNPDGTPLLLPAFVGTAGSFVDTLTLPQIGTYSILLDPQSNATGSARLTLYDVPADSVDPIVPSGNPVVVSPSVPGQNAKLTFSGTQNQRISVNVDQITIGTSSCCGGKVSITNPDGSQLVAPTFIGTATNTFLDTVTLGQTGTYTVLVDPQSNATGSARLTLYDVPADSVDPIVPSGNPVVVSPSVPGQNAKLTFSGTQNQRISVNVDQITIGTSSCCGGKVSITNPDGSQLVAPTFIGTATNTFLDTVTLGQTGTYTVLVDPQSNATGSARVSLFDVPADLSGAISIGGAAQMITLSTPGQNATLTFNGPAAKGIRLVLSNVTVGSSACCSGKVSIKKPDGSTLVNPTFFGTAGATVTAQLPVDGAYTIVIDPQSNATGSVTLTLTDPPASPNAVYSSALFDPLANLPTPPVSPLGGHPTTFPVRPQIDFNPPDAETWVPTRTNRSGDWRRDLAPTPWQSLTALQTADGVTALSGQALTLNGEPLSHVTVTLEDTSLETATDDSGRFLLAGAPAGHQVLIVDGRTAGTRGKVYGLFEIGVDLVADRTTALDYAIWMPRLDKAHERTIDSPTKTETVVTTPRIPGLELHLQPGTVIEDDDGHAVRKVSITSVPVDRPPFPLPLGVNVPLYFTIQPGGVYLSKAARLVYPNYTHLPPGQRVVFWNYDPDGRGWYVYGYGTVTPDATQVVPDAHTRIWAFSGAMIGGDPPPPNKGPKDKKKGGDPVDLGTGLFVSEKTDLVEPGAMPIGLSRMYRQGDLNSYSFGIGQTMPYDLRLWSVNNYQDADLILPDGGRVHYVRISPGTGFSDAVYEASTTPSAFFKSKIAWNGSGWDLTLKDGTVYVFGDVAPLQSIRDRFGNTVSLTRTSGQTGNITQITASSGRWIKLTYDGSNRITLAQDNSGRSVSYTYYATGELKTVTNAKGGVTTYTYDASHQLKTIKDPRNITYLTVDYDANGRVQKQTQGDGSIFLFAYVDDGNGNVTQTTLTEPNGNQRRIAFNADGYSTSEIAALGKPEQETTTYERQPGTNLLTAVVDQLNRRTELTYDGLGNATSVKRLAGTANQVTTSFTYDPKYSQLATVTDPLNHTTTYGYNAKGALTSVTDALNHQTSFAVNGAGQPTQITDALGHQTSLGYLLGDLVSVTNAAGNVTTGFVDNGGRLGSVTNALGNRTTYLYDGLNELTKATDAKSGVTNLVYDGNGNLTSLSDALTHATTYTYDSMDRLATRKDALLHQESYAYDGNGNLSLFTDRKSQKTRFKYDALNRSTFIGFGAAGTPPNETYTSSITNTYDGGDRLRTAVDSANGTITDTYDDLDRLTQETTAQGSVSYGYDAADRRQTTTVTGQPLVTYGYDSADRLTSISQGASGVAIAYDDANRRTSVTLPDSIAEQYAYDTADRLTGITYKLGASTLGDLNYSYDVAGQRNGAWGTYARTGLPAAQTYTYNAANQVTKVGTHSTTNDLNGSLTNDSVSSFTWNNRGQPATSSKTGLSASYAYDAYGRRKSKTVGSTTTGFVYDGANVAQELSGSTPTANLLDGPGLDEIYSRSDASGTKSFLTDALGSTLALADTSGTVSTSYTYEPFGNATSTGAASTNSFQYTGRENDGTGLDYLRARYYSPGLQRFLSEDPIGLGGGDVNLYAYVYNQPFAFVDRLGLCGSGAGGVLNALIGRCGFWSPIKEFIREVGPYAGACLKQGALGAIGGPEGFVVSCAVGAFDEYARGTTNPWVRYAAFTANVGDAIFIGGGVRQAQLDYGRPFRLWREYLP